jgi:hypothetical protein
LPLTQLATARALNQQTNAVARERLETSSNSTSAQASPPQSPSTSTTAAAIGVQGGAADDKVEDLRSADCRRRFSNKRSVLRFRCDGLGWNKANEAVVFEYNVCRSVNS